jgi:hypothetical protein
MWGDLIRKEVFSLTMKICLDIIEKHWLVKSGSWCYIIVRKTVC